MNAIALDASSVHSRSNEVVSERSRELLRSRQLAHDLSNALLGEQSLLSELDWCDRRFRRM